MDFDDDGYDAFSSTAASHDDRAECGICGRKFNADVLGRHQPICAKTQAKKRKVFDMAKQRAEGTEIAQVKAVGRGRGKPGKPPATYKASDIPVAAPKSNWRQKHQDFINSIRAARGVQAAIDQGQPLPPPPPPSINPDYVQCQYCERRFNQSAAERHIAFCREQHERLPNKSKVDPRRAAKQAIRTGYQPPKLRGKTSGSGSSLSSGGSNSRVSLSPGYGGGGSGGGSGYGGNMHSPSSPTSPSNKPPSNRSGGSRGRGTRPSPGGTHGGFASSNSSNYEFESSPVAGKALRTGRTAEGYSDARELSAKQRSSMTRKFPSENNIHGKTHSQSRYSGEELSSPTESPGRIGSGGMRNGVDSGYFGSGGAINRVGSAAKFCHECGTRYPVSNARFCCECGIRRMNVT